MSQNGKFRMPPFSEATTLQELERRLAAGGLRPVDEYEVVAHLEAMGYDRTRTQEELEVPDVPTLAHYLFPRLQKYPAKPPKATLVPSENPWFGRLALLAATALVLWFWQPSQLAVASVLWILAWSHAAAFMVWRLRSYLEPKGVMGGLSAVAWVGLLGLGLSLLGSSELRLWGIGLLWLGLALLIWEGAGFRALAFAALVAMAALGGWPDPWILILQGLLLILWSRSLRVWPQWFSLQYSLPRWWQLWPYLLYGVGMGLFWLALPVQALGFAPLFLAALLYTEAVLVGVKRSWKRFFWQQINPARLRWGAQLWVLAYVGLVSAAWLVVVPLMYTSGASLEIIGGLALLGLALALGLLHLSLGQAEWAALALALGGGLAWWGLSLAYAAGLAVCLLLLSSLWWSRQVFRYGYYLL